MECQERATLVKQEEERKNGRKSTENPKSKKEISEPIIQLRHSFKPTIA